MRFRQSTQTHRSRPAVSSSLSYGLVVPRRLLPTSPRGDAVIVGYGPESVCPERTFTSLVMAPLQAHVASPAGTAGEWHRESGATQSTPEHSGCFELSRSLDAARAFARRDRSSVRLPRSSAPCLRGENRALRPLDGWSAARSCPHMEFSDALATRVRPTRDRLTGPSLGPGRGRWRREAPSAWRRCR